MRTILPRPLLNASTVVVWVGLVAGCTTLLDNDFEGYGAGQSVVGPIPNDIDGDMIEASGTENLFTIETLQPLNGVRSLELREATVAPEKPFVLTFIPIDPTNQTRDIYISWKGRLSGAGPDTALRYTVQQGVVGTSNSQDALRIEIKENQMTIDGGNLADVTVNGDFSQFHRVFIRLSPTDATYVVDVSEGGVPADFEAKGNLKIDSEALVPLRIRLQARYTTPAQLSGIQTRYKLDDVLIEQRSF